MKLMKPSVADPDISFGGARRLSTEGARIEEPRRCSPSHWGWGVMSIYPNIKVTLSNKLYVIFVAGSVFGGLLTVDNHQ